MRLSSKIRAIIFHCVTQAGLKSLTYKFWIIAFTFSMFYGVWGGWTGVQSVILQPLGIDQVQYSLD